MLEDNDDRVAGFRRVLSALDAEYELKVWGDVPSMVAEYAAFFPRAALICLDHDLNPRPGVAADPGDGLDAARFLAGLIPVCPVLIHSSNTDRASSMHNELRFAGWTVDRVGPIGEDWIQKLWLPKARQILEAGPSNTAFNRPPDAAEREQRALASLEGLAIGDAIGEM